MVLTYNSQHYNADTASACVNNTLLAPNLSKPDTVILTMLNLDGLANANGEIVKITLGILSGSAPGFPLSLHEIKLYDADGDSIPIDSITTDIADFGGSQTEIPAEFKLFGNTPNPFNPETTIRYSVPKDLHVTLKIYNIMGQLVRTLVDDNIRAGEHTVRWDSRDAFGQHVPSGLYFYQLIGNHGEFRATKKMTLLK